MVKTRNSHHADTRQHILTTAYPIILGKGFAAVGLSEILSAAQVPKGSFYHYFESKEQFGCALLENYFDQYLLSIDDVLQDDDRPPLLRLLAYFENWQLTQDCDTSTDKCLVVKLSGEVTDLSEPMRLALNHGTQQIVARLATCIQQAMNTQAITFEDGAHALAQELYYLWVGATLLTKVNNTAEALSVAMRATRHRLGITTESFSSLNSLKRTAR